MELITFLVKHLYLLFILIGVVGSLLSRMRKPGMGGGSPMPPFGGGTPHRPVSTGPVRQAYPASQPNPRASVSRESTMEADSRLQAMMAAQEAAPRLKPLHSTGSGLPRPAVPSASPVRESVDSTPQDSIDRDDIIRGVIWAELLAPPRAKRPYRR